MIVNEIESVRNDFLALTQEENDVSILAFIQSQRRSDLAGLQQGFMCTKRANKCQKASPAALS